VVDYAGFELLQIKTIAIVRDENVSLGQGRVDSFNDRPVVRRVRRIDRYGVNLPLAQPLPRDTDQTRVTLQVLVFQRPFWEQCPSRREQWEVFNVP
jgi:hypothetical protein